MATGERTIAQTLYQVFELVYATEVPPLSAVDRAELTFLELSNVSRLNT